MADAAQPPQPDPRALALRQQRRLLLASAALVGGYYLVFGLAGVYRPSSVPAGLCVAATLAVAAWWLPRAAAQAEEAWSVATAAAVSGLVVLTASLSGGSACVGFQVTWALPLVYSFLFPTSLAACLAGGAVAAAGGLLVLVHDGQPPVHLVQWSALVAGGTLFAARRAVLGRRDQAALLDEERRRASRLARVEDRYRLLAEHTQDVIWTLDPATRRFTFVSPAVLRQRGFTVGEALTQTLDQALTPESLARAGAMLAAVGTPAEQDPHTGIYAQPRKDGSIIQVEITATLERDATGRAVSVTGTSREVTARVEAEQALRRSEQRFRALIEKSTDMILVFDREKRIQFWSPSATEVLGWTAEEVLGQTLWTRGLVHPDDAPALAEATREVVGGLRTTRRLRARHRHRDGSWRLLEGLGRNLLDDPAVGGVVVNLRDVTEEAGLEEQVRQAQKLESIGRLAGGVAHDFNNLLTVILSCASAIQRDASAGEAPDPEDLSELRAAGGRARDLTRQLMAFARKQPFAPVQLDLNEVVRRSEKLLKRLLGEDVTMQVDVADGPAPVLCDPVQLDQVILNLAVNARDAMPKGGTLTLATRLHPVGPAEAALGVDLIPGDWVQLEVRDTGVGMTPEVKGHLFEPFFTTKPEGQGTGLGLATVYGIVKQSGGHLHVESEPGRGAAFRICLPRLAETAEAAPPPRGAAAQVGGSEAILVVEDDELVRRVTVRVLRGAGYQVLVAAGGAEALEVVGRLPEGPRLVVTDVVMPGMGGREVAAALRGRWPRLPVLFVSGYTRNAIDERDLAKPGTAFLPKPFSPDGLLAKVRAMLDG